MRISLTGTLLHPCGLERLKYDAEYAENCVKEISARNEPSALTKRTSLHTAPVHEKSTRGHVQGHGFSVPGGIAPKNLKKNMPGYWRRLMPNFTAPIGKVQTQTTATEQNTNRQRDSKLSRSLPYSAWRDKRRADCWRENWLKTANTCELLRSQDFDVQSVGCVIMSGCLLHI